MNKISLQSLEQSSVVVKFHVFFLIMTVVPLGILIYLYWEISEEGAISLSPDQLNTVLILAVIGIIVGYVSMRLVLKNLVDVTKMSAVRLRKLMGADKVQEFLKGDENEIALLTRTFQEITGRLEENVANLEMTKKTLQSVLTRVGHGMSNIRNIDTFLDLIVETMTEALGGRKGFLLLVDQDKKALTVKTVYGASMKSFDKKFFSLKTNPFSAALHTRTALIIPKLQSLAEDAKDASEALDFPLVCAPLILRDEVLGVMAVSGKKVGSAFHEEEMALLLSLAMQTAVALENSKLNENADKTYFETLAALAMAVEAKDPYSRGHLDRVGQYCVAIGQHLGIDPEIVGDLRDGARIHDLGKIGVTDDVLSKPSSLNDQEWGMMKRHPEIGESIIRPITSLHRLCDLVRHHHEKLDGSGYPDKLKGDQISQPARILAIADIYDALTSDRPYRKAVASQDALRTLRDMGGLIDQDIVSALEAILKRP